MIVVTCNHDGCAWSLLVDDGKADATRAAHCWSTHRCVGECSTTDVLAVAR